MQVKNQVAVVETAEDRGINQKNQNRKWNLAQNYTDITDVV